MKKVVISMLVFMLAFSLLVGCAANESPKGASGDFDASSDISSGNTRRRIRTRGAFVELTGVEEKGEDDGRTDRTTRKLLPR